MGQFIENLEGRTLFSGSIQVVTADYQAVVADAGAIKTDFAALAATFKAGTKAIAADVKALGRNKTNSADIVKLNKAIAIATSLDAKATLKLIAAGKASLSRARVAFLVDVAHPTVANGARLSRALTALTGALAPYETALGNDIAIGGAKVSAALSALETANPTDAQLATDVSATETNSGSALSLLEDAVITTNSDINTLAAAIV
jgi:hypothetical protein